MAEEKFELQPDDSTPEEGGAIAEPEAPEPEDRPADSDGQLVA